MPNHEMSHSEPGTGNPPAPNKNYDRLGDNGSGSRRDAPAIVNPNADTVTGPNK